MLLALFTAALAGPHLESTYARDLLPHQGWPEIGGHVEGLLVDAGAHAWGVPVGWSSAADVPNYCAYRFHAESAAPWAVYFASDDETEGHNHLRNWTAGSAWETPVDATMLCSRTGARYGPSAPVQVVRVLVNDGQKVRRNLHFVATGVEVLDGTAIFRPDPDAVLTEL